jgi:hypothetical protein
MKPNLVEAVHILDVLIPKIVEVAGKIFQLSLQPSDLILLELHIVEKVI